MTAHNPRRSLLQAGLALGAGLLLPPAAAHEIITTNLRVIHPWTRATAPDASFAVVCMRFDDVTADDRLVLVASPVAEGAEMGGRAAGAVDFFIPEGQQTYLEEAGPQVRLTGLRFPLEVGRSYPLTLGFEKGGTYRTSISVDFTRFS